MDDVAPPGFELGYHHISLAASVTPTHVGPSTAFLPVDHPLPVGCAVELRRGDLVVPARVIRVVEALKGREAAPGMWVVVEQPLAGEAHQAWQDLVTRGDVIFPEPRLEDGASSATHDGAAARDAEPELVDDGRTTQVMNAVEIDAVLAGETQTEQPVEDQAGSGDGAVVVAPVEGDRTRPIGSGHQIPEARGKKRRRWRR